MKKKHSNPLTPTQEAELKALAALPEDQINTRDIPEQRDWSGARRGLFFRPVKKQLTLRLDADLIDWFKTHAPNGEGYQTSINSALREYVEQHGDTRSS
ncbi:MAG: BrnA antitoxin family protein [Acetobacteraceae bacterium]